MNDSKARLGSDTEAELVAPPCALEPVHIPGAIQPHGALLGVRSDGHITHASENLPAFLGRSTQDVLGRPLEEAIGEPAARMLLGIVPLGNSTAGEVHFLRGPNGGSLRLQAHRSGSRICIDIEPARSEAWQKPPVTIAQSVLETFKHAVTCDRLCELAVCGLKAVTGYNRVMAYRFGEDGHGEVIAEACDEGLDAYLGLRYPAADIPPQARAHYLRQRVGMIGDSDYEPVALQVWQNQADFAPLDLTHSALRSVALIHRKYMRNMKTAASLTIGLAHRQALWGMLVCHHEAPRVAGAELRAVADIIGQVVSLLIGSLGEAEAISGRLVRMTSLRALVDKLAMPGPLVEAFAAAETELLDVVQADGAAVRLSGELRYIGRTPSPKAVYHAFSVLQSNARGDILAVDNVGLQFTELTSCTSDGSGALLMPLAQGSDDAVIWFRPELVQTVEWGGNPTEHATLDPITGQLSPRASFSAWKETVRGRSAPWTEAQQAIVRELRVSVEAVIAQRTKVELAELRLQREQEQRVQNIRFKAALENMGDGLAMFDANEKLVVCNAQFGRIYGLPSYLQDVGAMHRDMVAFQVSKELWPDSSGDQASIEKLLALDSLSRNSNSRRIEKLADGRLIDVTWQPLEGGGWVSTHEDVTDRQRHEAKISFMAHHDLLTGLANRAFFAEKIEDAIARVKRYAEPFAVLVLDLDRFKNVNDTLGHPAGDRLLQEVAQRLKSALRETDVLTRLGGDEFAIIQSDEKNPREGAARLAARVVELISLPYNINGNVVSVGASVGISLAPVDANESTDLLKMADLALYQAKGEGRGCFRFFSREMLVETENRRKLEVDLRRAITDGEFELVYQAIINVETRSPDGFEALIRWNHPERGLIMPGDFIPIAEETGLISQIGEWVLNQACQDAVRWPAWTKLAVNLSPVQLSQSDLVNVVFRALAKSGFAAQRLELEITETALLKGGADYVTIIRELKALGVAIALDDFGTGYSSLSYATMFPIDKIKIDRSFILNLTKRSECAAIVVAVLALGRAIGAETVAEGVETEEQFAILKASGANLVQGYLFGRPCRASELSCPEAQSQLRDNVA